MLAGVRRTRLPAGVQTAVRQSLVPSKPTPRPKSGPVNLAIL